MVKNASPLRQGIIFTRYGLAILSSSVDRKVLRSLCDRYLYIQLVRCGLDIDLGIKGHSGILESMSTRATFLADATHRIRESLHSQIYFLAQSN